MMHANHMLLRTIAFPSVFPLPLYRYDDREWLPYAGTEIDFLTRPLGGGGGGGDGGGGGGGGAEGGKASRFSLVVQKYSVGKRYVKQMLEILYEQRIYDAFHHGVGTANTSTNSSGTASRWSAWQAAAGARREGSIPPHPPHHLPATHTHTQPVTVTRLMTILQRMQQIRWYWTYAGVINQIDAFFFDPLNARNTNGKPLRMKSHMGGGGGATFGNGNWTTNPGAGAGAGAGNYLRCVAPHSKQQDSSVLDLFL